MAEVVIIKQLDNSESMSYYNRKKQQHYCNL